MVKILFICTFFLLSLTGVAAGDLKKRTESGKTEGLHHVLVTVPGDEVGHCGGSLISAEWVLTAAHCNLTDLDVILGLHPDRKGERIHVTEKIQFSENGILHNIMLMKLKKKAEGFTIVELPSDNNCNAPSTDVVVTFFAWIYGNYNFITDKVEPEKLQKGELKVSKCENVDESEKQPLPEGLAHDKQKVLCTKHPPKVHDCELFGGSSLMYNGVLHGVLSNYDILCNKQVEFMNVCSYIKWIKSVAKA